MIYFDNAATTFPKPYEVIRGVADCMKNYCGNPGRGAHPITLAAAEAVYNARSEVASLFGSEKPENVIFTQNATHALNLAIFGTVKYGDHILISNLEHNSVFRPVYELYRRGIASYSVFDALGGTEQTLESFRKALRRNTRVAVTTHVSNICPKVLPVNEISALCREHGILHIIDASQSAGIRPLSIRSGASVICAPGHKGLYGPQGSGFCLFSDDFDFSRLSSTAFGGNGVNSASASMGNSPPESFEAGTLAVPSIVGLAKGIQFVKSTGIDKISAHESALGERIKKKLLEDGRIKVYLPNEKGSTLLFTVTGEESTSLASELAKKGVCLRAGMHCSPLAHEALGTGGDALRLSFGAFNTVAEADAFVYMLREITRKENIR